MYFDTKEKQQKLKQELDEWLETPYKHRTMVKGKGVDCIHLIIGVLLKLKIISPNLKYPDYDCDWHLHNSEELLYKSIKKNLNVTDISLGSIKNGDICLYKFGKASSHAAIYFDGYMYHSLLGSVVTKMVFKDAMWYSRLTYILRLNGVN